MQLTRLKVGFWGPKIERFGGCLLPLPNGKNMQTKLMGDYKDKMYVSVQFINYRF